jgi:hypothetical protein
MNQSSDPRFGQSARRVVLGLIVVLAIFLRLWQLDSSTFSYDYARVSNLAAQFIDTGIPPATGMVSSVGILNPPLFIYLLTLPVSLGRNPLYADVFIVLLNIAGIYGTYRLGRRYWSFGVGLVAMLLSTASPWMVAHSRGIAGQSLLAPGAVLFFTLLFAWFIERKRWALAGSLITLAALSQIHFAGLALAPLVALLLVFEGIDALRHRLPITFWQPLAAGIVIGGLLYGPYLAWDAAQGWHNIQQVLVILGKPSQLHQDVIDLIIRYIGGRDIHSLVGPQRFMAFLSGTLSLDYWPDRVEEALAIVGLAYLVLRLWRTRREAAACRRDGLLLLWVVVPVLVFMRSGSPVFPHYLNTVYPALYLILAVLLVDIYAYVEARFMPRVLLRGIGITALALIVGWQAYMTLSIGRFRAAVDAPDAGSTPIRIYMEVVHVMDRLRQLGGPRQVLVLCPGADPRFDGCPAAFQFLLGRSFDLQFLDYNSRDIWSRQEDTDTLAVLAPGASLAASELPHFATWLPNESVPLRGGAGAFQFYRIKDYFRGLADYLSTARADDAVIADDESRRRLLQAGYDGSLPIYTLPKSSQPSSIEQPEQIAQRHRNLYVISQASGADNSGGDVVGWLRSHAYAAPDTWLGPTRLIVFATQRPTSEPVRTMGADLGGQIRLVSYSRPATPVESGEILPLQLNWQALRAAEANYNIFAQLVDADNHVQAQHDLALAGEDRTAGTWQPGQLWTTLLGLQVPAGSPPGAYRLIVGLYHPQSGARLPSGSADHLDLGPVQVVRPRANAGTLPPGVLNSQPIVFPEITLLGWIQHQVGAESTAAAAVHPGGTLGWTFYWRAQAQPTADRRYMLRLVDDGGTERLKTGAQLGGNRYPTARWVAGELVRDESNLSLPSDLPAGRYRVQIAVESPTGSTYSDWRDLGSLLVGAG